MVVPTLQQQPGARDLDALARFGGEVDQALHVDGIRCQQRIKAYRRGQQF